MTLAVHMKNESMICWQLFDANRQIFTASYIMMASGHGEKVDMKSMFHLDGIYALRFRQKTF